MNIYAYDQALMAKLKGVFPNVVESPWETLFSEEVHQEGSESRVVFPLLGLTRVSWGKDGENANHLAVWRGTYRNLSEGAQVKRTQYPSIGIMANYQLDVISDNRRETDAIATEILFYLETFPNVFFTVTRPYTWVCRDSSLFIGDINDNTDITSFGERGRIWRTTFELTLRSAMAMQVRGYKPVDRILLAYVPDTGEEEYIETLSLEVDVIPEAL